MGVLATLLGVGGAALLVAPADILGPRELPVYLETVPQTVDLGDVFVGAEHAFEVKLHNRAGRKLWIKAITPSCGCTVATVDPPEISARGFATLSGVLKGDRALGDFTQLIRIDAARRPESSTSEARASVVRLRGRVVSRVEIAPCPAILRPEGISGHPFSAELEITNTSPDALTLEEPTPPADGVAAELESVELRPHETTTLHLRITGPVMTTEDLIVNIPCRHPAERAIKVPVRICPKDAVDIQPRSVEFGAVTAAMLRRRMPLVVTVSGDVLSRCRVSVLATPPYVRVASIRSLAEDRQTIMLTLASEVPGFDLRGDVVIELRNRGNDALLGTARCRLYGYVVSDLQHVLCVSAT